MAVTLKVLAEEVGVSVTTVSRALAGYDDVAEETRQRILATAERLGYHPNITARRLQKRRTDTIGFVFPTTAPRFSDPFFTEFLAGVGNEAAAHDYDLLLSTHAPQSPGEQAAYRRAAQGGWVDGLIVVRTRANDARIRLLCEHHFPFVAFGRSECGCDFPYVDEDSEAGMRLLVEHFVELGHRAFAFIAPPQGLNFGRYRLRALRRVLADAGIRLPETAVVPGDMTQQSGAAAAARLLALNPVPTAIICGNDLMAIGAIKQLQQAGLRVGQDVSVGGFDDIPLAAYITPALTTIHQPIHVIGSQVCSMLIDILNGRVTHNPQVLLTPTLIVRDSSGPVMQ